MSAAGLFARRHGAPLAMIESILTFVRDGYGRRPPGDFLQACLANDFLEAVCRADDVNKHRLREIATFIHNELPSGCHGSRDAVKTWEGGVDFDDEGNMVRMTRAEAG